MVSKLNTESSAVQSELLSHLDGAMRQADHQYRCHVNSDQDWIKFGVLRVLHHHDSGREFFQDMRMDSLGQLDIRRQDFQEGLKSMRRLKHLSSINSIYLEDRSQQAFKNKDGSFHPLLDSFHIYSGDGHFHAASTHDERDDQGRKNAVGHLYAQNLRNRDMSHLALSSDGTRKKPHDLGTIKKMDIESLRQGARRGQKVLYVWDRAIIDFSSWMRWKHNNGIYFVTRSKKNMNKEVIGNISVDGADAQNSGVISDQLIEAGGAEALRMITYHDAEIDETFEFITNLRSSLPPGMVVQLYRMRWDIEKVFDELKNKLEETKAWSKSLTGKRMQAQFIVLCYNLLLRLRDNIEQREGIKDTEQEKKQELRWSKTLKCYELAKRPVPTWLATLRRTTQLGVKFIRWVRGLSFRPSSWSQALGLLAHEYGLK